MKLKKTISILILILFFILMIENTSQAALQSNGGTVATYGIDDWITKVRAMEKTGGTFGLNASIDSSTQLDTTASNNLDVHLQKNTEYGAMAILSASSYGNSGKITAGATTTGNSTGVVMPLTVEWTCAGQFQGTNYSKKFTPADARYKNYYTYTPQTVKKGDALLETLGWHGGTGSWLGDNYKGGSAYISAQFGFARGFKTIFSYSGGSYNDFGGIYSQTYAGRAVVVVGEDV